MAGVQTKKRIIIPVIAVLMAALISLVWAGITYGWFEAVKETPGEVKFGSSDAYATVTFVDAQGDHTLSTNDSYYYEKGSSFEVDLFDKGAENYFSKMRVTVNFQGTTESCLRVQFIEQWKGPDGKIMRRPITSMGVNTGLWINLWLTESTFYYWDASAGADGWRVSSPVTVKEVGDKELSLPDLLSFPLITSGAGFNEQAPGTTLRLGIKVQSVQFNRYQEIWGIDAYPTR